MWMPCFLLAPTATFLYFSLETAIHRVAIWIEVVYIVLCPMSMPLNMDSKCQMRKKMHTKRLYSYIQACFLERDRNADVYHIHPFYEVHTIQFTWRQHHHSVGGLKERKYRIFGASSTLMEGL